MKPWWAGTVLLAALGGLPATAADDRARYSVEQRRSGSTFLAPETRALQEDDFAIPGLLWVEQGQRLWDAAAGNAKSCAQCHQQWVGSRLRGEVISQGQINGHPVYRQIWQTMGSSHRMFAWCNEAVRAEPHLPGSQEYVDLELFVKWLGRGLPVETPAMRR